MAITQADIDNIHKLESYLKTPRTAGEVATYLGISRMKALDYIEIMLKKKPFLKKISSALRGAAEQ